ncbi:hypothetical protein AALC17_13525 [Oscillospiraceae bacterium 38-13]
MKQIDRLLIEAQRISKGGLELTLAMVLPDGDSWTADAHLWNRKQGATINRSSWPTMEAAVEHIHELAKEYLNSKDVPVIIADL